jgi:hypothetical protein
VRDLLLERSQVFDAADVTGAPWTEIDFPNDVARAADEILPQLQPLVSASRQGAGAAREDARQRAAKSPRATTFVAAAMP